jgi:hypothetical protein
MATLAVLAALLVIYGGAYVWARATHRLVRYSGGVIQSGGWGLSPWDFVFLPATFTEQQVRRLL